MDYEEAYRRMIKTRDELRSKNFVDDSDKEEFKRLTTECNKASSALEKLIKNTMKLKGEAVNENPYLLGSDFKDDKDGRVSELTNFVQGIKGADLATLQFKDNWNEVVFAVDNGDGTFTQMTATFTDARNEIVALAGDTKKVQGKFESFIDGVKNRLQSSKLKLVQKNSSFKINNYIKYFYFLLALHFIFVKTFSICSIVYLLSSSSKIFSSIISEITQIFDFNYRYFRLW